MAAPVPLPRNGGAVEVSGLEDEGFPNSFFAATVLTRNASTATVQLTNFFEADDKTPCLERVALERLRPEPPPPPPRYADTGKTPLRELYPLGTSVDAWLNDMWWEGEVSKIIPRGIVVTHPGAWPVSGALRRAKTRGQLQTAVQLVAPAAARAAQRSAHAAGGRGLGSTAAARRAIHAPARPPPLARRSRPKTTRKTALTNTRVRSWRQDAGR
jgi:hypothetical protein